MQRIKGQSDSCKSFSNGTLLSTLEAEEKVLGETSSIIEIITVSSVQSDVQVMQPVAY